MKVKLITLLVLIINIIFLSMILFIIESKERVNFSLIGDNPYLVDSNKEYEDPGYIAEICQRKNCNKLEVQVTDLDKNANSYEIKYTTKYKGKEYNLYRTIKSVDKTAPVIKLKGKEKVTVCPTEEYKEEGFSATDNVDGDITENVAIEENKNKIIYSVEDSSKNRTEITRTINSEDKTAPVITLKGAKTITIYLGERYQEKGYTATDNCSGNLTSKVTVTKNIDTNKIGTYKVTYSVEDKYHNKSVVYREVVVKERPVEKTNVNKDSLTSYIKQKKYNVSVGYYNLKTGNTYFYQPDKVYFGASLVKTVDAMYIYEKTTPNSNTISKIKKAISVSNNQAHLDLVKIIGRDKLKSYGQSLGAKHFLTSKVNLYYGDTTVRDQLAIWKHLYKVINNNPRGSELKGYFINTYGNCLLFDGIPTTMHKYGRQSEYYHDVGIVFTNKPYIVIILTRHGNNNFKSVIKDLSKKIYEYNKIDN